MYISFMFTHMYIQRDYCSLLTVSIALSEGLTGGGTWIQAVRCTRAHTHTHTHTHIYIYICV